MSGAVTGRGRALWFLVFWTAIGVGSYIVGVQSAIGQQAEASVLDAAEFTTDPPAPLNLVSIPSVAVALLLVGLLALAVHGIRRAVVVTVVSALAVIASQLLKLRLLSRPELLELDAPNTFPSGHMTVFAVLVASFVWAVPARVRALTALLGAVLISAVGWQLLGYGWHRPSDVLGALALGVVAFALACIIRPATSRGTAVLARTSAIALLIAGALLVAVALVLAWLAASSANAELMLRAGQVGIVGASTLAARALFLLGGGRG